ncbi:YceI family protein [Alysiella filiformis]|uniref:Polyisoprenoid-binding protein YceI n=1 Tax=Alysiella filiformis DSM 16848 TaxID=1120981 RepID=A0A286E5B6_9NEIS|nr:YceI family protein [Alysiella filiformis]QMT30407.1 polyisoprenoid-binding protein [Alysiella filiformis]UBQ56611.1 YceI family protein [Alysiella filiformis DSM 16848]SOD66064.1 Polyisoprenoid-binding protein YceI [Alysiella filiformis DSM 16848]
MKRILFSSLIALAAASASAAEYKIDAHHTNARFAIDHFATSTNVGGFYDLNGTMQFDAAKRTGAISLTLPLANLQTGSSHFTEHLKSADLFHAEKFPEMKFESTKFKFSGSKVKAVEGNLTLLGKTHPVTLKASKFNCYPSPMLKTEVCGGDFKTTIDRTKWGMNYLVDVGMSKNVDLTIQIEAAKQ